MEGCRCFLNIMDWIKCILSLATMSVRRKSARKKKRKPEVDATVGHVSGFPCGIGIEV